MSDAVAEVERARSQETWERFAFLAAHVINISGKVVKRRIKASDLLGTGKTGTKRLTEEEIKKRRKDFIETAKIHKAKFWTKIKDTAIARLTENRDGNRDDMG
jgi:hypothetical protein